MNFLSDTGPSMFLFPTLLCAADTRVGRFPSGVGDTYWQNCLIVSPCLLCNLPNKHHLKCCFRNTFEKGFDKPVTFKRGVLSMPVR